MGMPNTCDWHLDLGETTMLLSQIGENIRLKLAYFVLICVLEWYLLFV